MPTEHDLRDALSYDIDPVAIAQLTATTRELTEPPSRRRRSFRPALVASLATAVVLAAAGAGWLAQRDDHVAPAAVARHHDSSQPTPAPTIQRNGESLTLVPGAARILDEQVLVDEHDERVLTASSLLTTPGQDRPASAGAAAIELCQYEVVGRVQQQTADEVTVAVDAYKYPTPRAVPCSSGSNDPELTFRLDQPIGNRSVFDADRGRCIVLRASDMPTAGYVPAGFSALPVVGSRFGRPTGFVLLRTYRSDTDHSRYFQVGYYSAPHTVHHRRTISHPDINRQRSTLSSDSNDDSVLILSWTDVRGRHLTVETGPNRGNSGLTQDDVVRIARSVR